MRRYKSRLILPLLLLAAGLMLLPTTSRAEGSFFNPTTPTSFSSGLGLGAAIGFATGPLLGGGSFALIMRGIERRCDEQEDDDEWRCFSDLVALSFALLVPMIIVPGIITPLGLEIGHRVAGYHSTAGWTVSGALLGAAIGYAIVVPIQDAIGSYAQIFLPLTLSYANGLLWQGFGNLRASKRERNRISQAFAPTVQPTLLGKANPGVSLSWHF